MAESLISIKAFGKMQVNACKKAYYEKNFNSGKEIVVGMKPFYIYCIAKLFAECNTDKKLTQKDMLENLSSKYLF